MPPEDYLIGMRVRYLSSTTNIHPHRTLTMEGRSSTSHITDLHPEGDIVLIILDKGESSARLWLRASTAVLRKASPYFKALFGPRSREDRRAGGGTGYEMVLKEHKPEAVEVVLSLLHKHHNPRFATLKPALFAHVAILADKYDCVGALKDQIGLWFKNAEKPEPNDCFGHGHLITAAVYLESPQHYRHVTAAAIPDFTSDWITEWSRDKAIKNLGDDVIGIFPVPCCTNACLPCTADEIKEKVRETKIDIRTEIESVEKMLRAEDKICYRTGQQRCPACFQLVSLKRNPRLKHPPAPQCEECRVKDLTPELCTNYRRVADYFDILRAVGVWPSNVGFDSHISARALVGNIAEYAERNFRHRCEGGPRCPLPVRIEQLDEALHERLGQIRGLTLEEEGKGGR